MAITVTEPKKWAVELGATADVNEIPETTDTESGLASMTALFPQLTALPLDAGGRAPQREDFNGLYKLIGQWVRFYMYGGVPSWTSSAAYPAGSLCSYNNSTWTALRASTNIKPAEGKYWHALSNFYTSSLLVADLLNKVYPVGSIYMSAVNISPASFLGGTWVVIEQGRMLMAAGSSWQAGTTGGAAYHALTVQEMPAHDHSATETAAGGHTHNASTGSAGAHSHSGSTNSTGNHYHTGTTSTDGAHHHGTWGDSNTRIKPPFGYYDSTRNHWGNAGVHSDQASLFNTSTDGNHSHSFSTSWSGEHAHSLSIASAGAHTHSVAIAAAGAHTHAITIGKTGSGAAFSILPPYVAVYMWRRTA